MDGDFLQCISLEIRGTYSMESNFQGSGLHSSCVTDGDLIKALLSLCGTPECRAPVLTLYSPASPNREEGNRNKNCLLGSPFCMVGTSFAPGPFSEGCMCGRR